MRTRSIQAAAIALLLLALGAAMSLVVALACSLWVTYMAMTDVSATPGGAAAVAAAGETWARDRPEDFIASWDGAHATVKRGVGFRTTYLRNGERERVDALTIYAAGWPLHALAGRRWRRVDLVEDPQLPGAMMISGGSSVDDGMSLLTRPPRWMIGVTAPRVVPTRPAWVGLALDSLLYAALLGAGWAAVVIVRRRRRVRAGHCPACGYPFGTAARCSECGTPIR